MKVDLEIHVKRNDPHEKGLVVLPGKGVGSRELISFEVMWKSMVPSVVGALVKCASLSQSPVAIGLIIATPQKTGLFAIA